MAEEQQWLNINQEIEHIIRLRYSDLKDQLVNLQNMNAFLDKEVHRLKAENAELLNQRR